MSRFQIKIILILIAGFTFSELQAGQKEAALNLDIDRAVSISLERNDSLKAARKNIKEARGGLITARAGFFPSLSVSGSHVYLDQKMQTTAGIDPLTGRMISESLGRDRFSITGSVRQPLFTGFRNYSNYRRSRDNLKLQQTNYRAEKNELIFKVKEAYYRALLTKDLLELNREVSRQIEEHVLQTEIRYENGLASRLELLRARVELDNQRPDLTEANNRYRQTRSALKALLGIDMNKTIELKDTFDTRNHEFKKFEPNKEISKTLKNNPSIQALKIQNKMVQKNLTVARSERYPNIFALYNYNYDRPDRGIDEWGESWSIMLSVELPLFTGFATRGKIKSARANVYKIEHTLQEVKKNIILAAENAVLKLNREKETIQSQVKNVSQAREALDIAGTRYKNGLISNLEFMDTRLAATRAQLNLLRAKSDYFTALARLKKITGGEH